MPSHGAAVGRHVGWLGTCRPVASQRDGMPPKESLAPLPRKIATPASSIDELKGVHMLDFERFQAER